MSRVHCFVLSVVAALTLGACSPGSVDRSAAPTAQDPGIEHVHGLAVDPADGVLYAATHYGVFRMPADTIPIRVADRYQDTMGFTVIGPNSFLGSGHPDVLADPDLPSRQGSSGALMRARAGNTCPSGERLISMPFGRSTSGLWMGFRDGTVHGLGRRRSHLGQPQHPRSV